MKPGAVGTVTVIDAGRILALVYVTVGDVLVIVVFAAYLVDVEMVVTDTVAYGLVGRVDVTAVEIVSVNHFHQTWLDESTHCQCR